jgi:UDP-glucuronate 4-epimerase
LLEEPERKRRPKDDDYPRMNRYLVTGAAGFIGYHVARRLLEDGRHVIGVDNLSPYYDVSLKEARLRQLTPFESFRFHRRDVSDREAVEKLFEETKPTHVVHMAAQPGVRHSLVEPFAYTDTNVTGFLTILEGCRHIGVRHLVFASSSSVYGGSPRLPFSEHDPVDHPISLYAATKRANELMAHAYAHLFGIPCTGLRFFTVYGPWGRPDMALFSFTKAILKGETIPLFNEGRMVRDYTYVDDVVEGVVRILERPPSGDPNWPGVHPDPATSKAPFRLYNVGNSQPVDLMRFVDVLAEKLGRTVHFDLLPLQPGDVPVTQADVRDLEEVTGFRPSTPIESGIGKFVAWYQTWLETE